MANIKDTNLFDKRKKCIDKKCKKAGTINVSKLLITPFLTNSKDTNKLLAYFMYFAPNVESIHSRKIHRKKHEEIFEQLMKNRYFKYQKFCSSNTPIEKELEKAFMEGTEYCIKCKRYVCKKKPPKKKELPETELDCFLRHIRNSIAHGRVYYKNDGNRVRFVFEDLTPSSNNISARIVCIKADLEYWKSILSNPKNYKGSIIFGVVDTDCTKFFCKIKRHKLNFNV